MAKELTKREENYSQWYNDLVIKADLAENSAVRGCMVIKPMVMQSGKEYSLSWTRCSKIRAIPMPIFRCLYQNLFSAKKPVMYKDLPRNVR